MARHDLKHLVEFVRGKSRSRRAALLTPDLLAVELKYVIRFRSEQRNLVLRKAIREENVTFVVEGFKLLGRKLHGALPWRFRPLSGFRPPYYSRTGGMLPDGCGRNVGWRKVARSNRQRNHSADQSLRCQEAYNSGGD